MNISKSGVSLSKRVGPLTLRKKKDPTTAFVMLAIGCVLMAAAALFFIVRALLVLIVWLCRWAVFGTQALFRRA